MIKGRYVATVEIDVSMNENEPNLLPFDEINEHWRSDTTKYLTEIIEQEFYPHGKVKVTQQYVDMYLIDEQEGDRCILM